MEPRKPPMSVKDLMKKKKGIVRPPELVFVPTHHPPEDGSMQDLYVSHTPSPTEGSTMHPPISMPGRDSKAAKIALEKEKNEAKRSKKRKAHCVSLFIFYSD